MAVNPNFISTPRLGRASLSAANTNIDGTGTITPLTTFTPPAAGLRVLEIAAQCSATSIAALVNLFLSSDSGSTWRMFDQLAIAAATVSVSVKGTRVFTAYTNLILPDATWRLGCTTTVAQATEVFAFGGDLT